MRRDVRDFSVQSASARRGGSHRRSPWQGAAQSSGAAWTTPSSAQPRSSGRARTWPLPWCAARARAAESPRERRSRTGIPSAAGQSDSWPRDTARQSLRHHRRLRIRDGPVTPRPEARGSRRTTPCVMSAILGRRRQSATCEAVLVFELRTGGRDIAGDPVNAASKLEQDCHRGGFRRAPPRPAVSEGTPAPREACLITARQESAVAASSTTNGDDRNCPGNLGHVTPSRPAYAAGRTRAGRSAWRLLQRACRQSREARGLCD